MGGYQFLNYLEDEENIHTETLDEILETHLIDVRRYYYPRFSEVSDQLGTDRAGEGTNR
jgi:hypothetical protein